MLTLSLDESTLDEYLATGDLSQSLEVNVVLTRGKLEDNPGSIDELTEKERSNGCFR
jgi:hypothetical protein